MNDTRHTADSITDDVLDALYAERDRYAAALAKAREDAADTAETVALRLHDRGDEPTLDEAFRDALATLAAAIRRARTSTRDEYALAPPPHASETDEPSDGPVYELRAAAFQLRNPFHAPGLKAVVDSDLIDPLADWLEEAAEHLAEHLPAWDGTRWLEHRTHEEPAPPGYRNPKVVADLVQHHFGRALAVARAINSQEQQ